MDAGVVLLFLLLRAVVAAPGGFTCANCPCRVGSVNCKGREIKRVSEIGMSGNASLATQVDLSDNLLRELDELTFSELRQTTVLNLAGNRLSVINDRDFEGLASVLSMDLSRNDMKTIHPDSFSHTPKLVRLSLWGNELQRIDFLQSMFSLVDLDASFNSVQSIDAGTFATCAKLKTLVLKFNKLSRAEFTADMHTCALATLDLGYNNITAFQGQTFTKCANLTSLDLSGNSIQSLDLSGLSSLRKLYLSDAGVSEDVLPSLASTPMLDTLLLSGNRIASISASAFSGLAHLNVLSLSRNRLLKIPDGAFAGCPGLELVFLAHNAIDHVGEGVFSAPVRDNDIASPPGCRPSTSSSRSSISYLDLSDNRLRNLNPQVFSSLRWAEVKLNHNLLGTFGPDLVCVMKQRDLDITLEGNPLACTCGEFYDVVSLSERLNVKLDITCKWDCSAANTVPTSYIQQSSSRITVPMAYVIAITGAVVGGVFAVAFYKKRYHESVSGYLMLRR